MTDNEYFSRQYSTRNSVLNDKNIITGSKNKTIVGNGF